MLLAGSTQLPCSASCPMMGCNMLGNAFNKQGHVSPESTQGSLDQYRPNSHHIHLHQTPCPDPAPSCSTPVNAAGAGRCCTCLSAADPAVVCSSRTAGTVCAHGTTPASDAAPAACWAHTNVGAAGREMCKVRANAVYVGCKGPGIHVLGLILLSIQTRAECQQLPVCEWLQLAAMQCCGVVLLNQVGQGSLHGHGSAPAVISLCEQWDEMNLPMCKATLQRPPPSNTAAGEHNKASRPHDLAPVSPAGSTRRFS